MIFKLQLDRNHVEEIVATVHQRTALIDEIERLVTQDNLSEQIPGYEEDEMHGLLRRVNLMHVQVLLKQRGDPLIAELSDFPANGYRDAGHGILTLDRG